MPSYKCTTADSLVEVVDAAEARGEEVVAVVTLPVEVPAVHAIPPGPDNPRTVAYTPPLVVACVAVTRKIEMSPEEYRAALEARRRLLAEQQLRARSPDVGLFIVDLRDKP